MLPLYKLLILGFAMEDFSTEAPTLFPMCVKFPNLGQVLPQSCICLCVPAITLISHFHAFHNHISQPWASSEY